MNDLNIKKTISKILLYALVGISCFACWYIIIAVVLANFKLLDWSEGQRLILMMWTLGSLFLIILNIEINK